VVAALGWPPIKPGFSLLLRWLSSLIAKKFTSIRCDGFPYFRSEGVERCGSDGINERPGLS
jgi:hypothetical protein